MNNLEATINYLKIVTGPFSASKYIQEAMHAA